MASQGPWTDMQHADKALTMLCWNTVLLEAHSFMTGEISCLVSQSSATQIISREEVHFAYKVAFECTELDIRD